MRPLTPQNAAGMRTEPPVSVPSASAAAPVASATPEPPLELPLTVDPDERGLLPYRIG